MKDRNNAYSVAVLVNGKPVTEVPHQGETYIEGRSNSVFELQFKNKTSQRVLLVPSVDGLNVIDGGNCGTDSEGYVIGPYGEITIPGWTVDSGTVAKFQFKKQGGTGKNQTYTEAIEESEENQGLIGFMVFKEKPVKYTSGMWTSTDIIYHGDPSPRYRYDQFGNNPSWDSGKIGGYVDDTPTIMSACASPSPADSVLRGCDTATYTTTSVTTEEVDEASLGTGFGKAADFNTTTVSFDKEKKPEAVFVFHYDTKKNLVKMGVPVELLNKHHTKKQPSAFPKSPEVRSGCKIPSGWHG